MILPSLSRTARLIIAGVVAVALLFGVLQVRSCQNAKREAAALRVGAAQAKAGAESATDAIATQADVNQREREADDLTRQNERDIRDAKGADQPVDPDVHAAGMRALCRRAAYRDTERCRLLQPNPR